MPDSRPCLLIVDDQAVNLRILATALDPDFTVRVATNGADALAVARRSPCPEVILLDVMMPGMDGYAVCAALKADALTADIPIIFITACTDADSESQALAHGGADFIHKPIDVSVLVQRVGLQVTLRERERALRETNQRLEIALEAAAMGLWDYEIATRSLSWSARHALLLGLSPETLGATLTELGAVIHPRYHRACLASLRRALREGIAFDQVYRVICPDGSRRWLHSRGQLTHDLHGIPERLIGTTQDISTVKTHQQQLVHLAHHDALTGLPNRLLLSDRLGQALAQARRHRQQLAVVYLDLDGFKAVNDVHGHAMGDELLQNLAQRMSQCLREVDTLARLGGDEFAVVLVNLSDTDGYLAPVRRLLAAAAKPVCVGALRMQVSASLGISLYPQAEEVDGDHLLRQADQAMYQAKQSGRNCYCLYTDI